ncbi:thioesterase family protein [Alicyclobacillus sp. SO9]|uniref:acyl-CoA thioesterase n=1 Tax=Alicyclobacillus sp. SO9 TaxID=2665646 RepID=UPI0018E874A6|nr:thioesterase family protein [Alicyclobacillus sp. SO9]QQE80360.1 acyl-CoA thioesterase [Alicyclobacillus sp. SO9]
MLTHQVRVSFSDCDGLGHVNHAKYFTYMEEARADVFRFFNPTLELDKWNLIVVSARCDYLQQVSYMETLTVLTWISKVGTASFTVDHVIQNETGDYVARGQGVLIAYDYKAQKAHAIWPEAKEKLQQHGVPPEGVPPLR